MKQYCTRALSFDSGSLESCVEYAYREILAPNPEYPYLINVRNFVSDIIGYESDATQRYHLFNTIRKIAYEKSCVYSFPTACCVGTPRGSTLTSVFEVSYTRATTPAKYFSNKLQTDSFKYPLSYGTPQFSRAAVHGNNLLISGTASIRGSTTVHIGDTARQLITTLDNIESLKRESGLNARASDLNWTTYVKYYDNNELVDSILRSYGIESEIINCDICRDNLLVEIEAYSKDITS